MEVILMSNVKKILALICACLFVLSLVACNGDNDENTVETNANGGVVTEVTTEEGQTTTVVNGTTANGKTEKTKVTSPKKTTAVATQAFIKRTTNRAGNASSAFIKKLKGFTLKILYPWENIYGVTKCKPYYDQSMKEVEKEYGVKIKEEGKWNNYNEMLASQLAAKDCTNHIYYAQGGNFASYFKKGYISDLTTAMREAAVDFNDPWYISEAKGFLNINGKQYGWVPYEDEYTTPGFILYNKTLLSRKNLTDPAKLAKQGKWTWDTMETYAKKFDNDKSVTGMGTVSTTSLVQALCTNYGTSLVKVKKGTSPTTNIDSSSVKSALNTFAEWCVGKKAWCNTFKDKAWNHAKLEFSKGKVAMLYGNQDTATTLKGSKDNSAFGVAPFPTKSGSKTYTNTSNAQFIAFVPICHQSIASKILFVRNEYYRYTYRYADRCAKYRWDSYLGDAEAVNNAINIKYARNGNKTVLDWQSTCEDSDANVTTESVIKDIVSGKSSVATAISSKKTALKKTYAKVWDGYKTTGNV